jgi:hypothetical protein
VRCTRKGPDGLLDLTLLHVLEPGVGREISFECLGGIYLVVDKSGLPDMDSVRPVIAGRTHVDPLPRNDLKLSERSLNAHLVFLSG